MERERTPRRKEEVTADLCWASTWVVAEGAREAGARPGALKASNMSESVGVVGLRS